MAKLRSAGFATAGGVALGVGISGRGDSLYVSSDNFSAFVVALGLTSGGDELEVAGVSCDVLCANVDVIDDVVLPEERAPDASRSYSSCVRRAAFSLSFAARSA